MPTFTPQLDATPLAIKLAPSPFPYQFTELVNFRGDFDQSVRPGEVVNPKGLAYHPQLDRLLVSLSPYNTAGEPRIQQLNQVERNSTRRRFAPTYTMFRAVEAKIAIVPLSGPPVAAGFTPGEIFVGRGPNTEVSRLSAQGDVLADVFANFGAGGGMWGALTFDTEGSFGGRMIAASAEGKIFLVSATGAFTELIDLQLRLEGATVAPPTFGPLAQQLIVGVEGYGDQDMHGGEIYAINAAGKVTMLANIGYAVEHLEFIPPQSGTYYQNEICFDRERENRLLSVSASQFLNRLGRLIAVNELTGELTEIAWEGARYTQQSVGTVPGRWSSAGFFIQGTELEAGCFAVRAPVVPKWTDWALLPGTLVTDRAPSVAASVYGDLYAFTVSQTNRHVFSNHMRRQDAVWEGWQEESALPAQPLVTPHALSSTQHNAVVYAFGVLSDGRIQQRVVISDNEAFGPQAWHDVPGGMLTTTAVASGVANGRLVLCALGQNQGIFLNELQPGGRAWSGWSEIPGGGRTDVTPTVATFQDELYVFIKGLTSRRILVKTRSADGVWTPWAEVPGAGRADAPISAVSTQEQLYLFIKQPETRAPLVNIASPTGTWSGWLPIPNGGSTDAALAATAVENRVYLFAKGIDDRRIWVRMTL
ncbi:MAG: hypothetical protein HYR56_23550 [Acidobacteria bacterium]|nr:hypothetical protein [Acidobacteriota bacterium]MBI3426262.1 hypothetical protein [Acidobacteriota bacterium]